MLNRSSRRFQITVGELDVTSLVQYFEVGDDRVSSSGLIATRGSIKLRYNPKFNVGRDPKISLDPKIPDSASYWSRGVSVKLWITDSALTLQKHPRHSLRILSSRFDRDELSLTLEVGCLLALLDSQQPEGDKSDTCVNQRRSVDDVIRSLLIGGAQDYPSASINYIGVIPGFIESPQEKGSGGSYVGEAGKIAYGRGYCLWVTKDEEIKGIKIAPADSLPKIVLDADKDSFNYVRNDGQGSNAETPYDRVRVRYTVVNIKETEQSFSQTTEEYGVTEFSGSTPVIIRKTQVIDDLSFARSRRTIKTTRWLRYSEIFPWAFATGAEEDSVNPVDRLTLGETEETIYTYEPTTLADLDEACKDEGANGLEGRLLSKSTTVKRAKGWVYSEWIDQHQLLNALPLTIKVEDDGIVSGVTDPDSGELYFTHLPLIPYSAINTVYKFLDSSDDEVKTIDETREIHRAAIFPKAWKYTRRSPNIPEGLVNAGGVFQSWRRRLGSQEWGHQLTERKPLGLAARSVCDARFKKALSTDFSDGIDPDNSRALAVASVREFAEQITTTRNEITVSSTQTTPPAPEFIPERYSRTEEEVVVEFPISSQYSTGGTGKVKEITLDNPIERSASSGQSSINSIGGLAGVGLRGIADDLAQAKNQAKIEALLVWSRFRSVNLTYDLRDLWFNVPQLPLLRFDVLDYDRITAQYYRHSYLVDGWTNAVTLRECLVSHDGLWQGAALAINPYQITVASAIPPNSEYIQVEPLAYSLQEGDSVVIDVEAALVVAESAQGSSVINLSSGLASELPAGSTFLLQGFSYTVAAAASPGSTSIVVEAPLASPISAGSTATVGTIATVTAFIPIGSTAILVEPTSNTSSISPSAVTVDIETILPPAQLPVDFESIGVGTHSVQIFERLPIAQFEAIGVGAYPASPFENIGTAEFEAIGQGTHEVDISNPRSVFTAIGLGLHEGEQTLVSEFESIGAGVHASATPSKAGSFEIIAIW